jgi:hypothetical protein
LFVGDAKIRFLFASRESNKERIEQHQQGCVEKKQRCTTQITPDTMFAGCGRRSTLGAVGVNVARQAEDLFPGLFNKGMAQISVLNSHLAWDQ